MVGLALSALPGLDELGDEPRFADAGFAGHHGALRVMLGKHPLESVLQRLQCILTADHRRP